MNTIAEERYNFFENIASLDRENFKDFFEATTLKKKIYYHSAHDFAEGYTQSNACWQKSSTLAMLMTTIPTLLMMTPSTWKSAGTVANRFLSQATLNKMRGLSKIMIPFAYVTTAMFLTTLIKPEGQALSFLNNIFPETYKKRKAAAEEAFNLRKQGRQSDTMVYDNDMINPHPTSKYQHVSGLENRDYTDYSFLDRINNSQQQAVANGFGYSLFDMNDPILRDDALRDDQQIFDYLKQNTDQNGPLEILQWNMHGDSDGQTIYNRVKALVDTGILARGSTLIMDQCTNADVTNEKQAMCQKAAKDFGVHIYASDRKEYVGKGFTGGMMYFNLDGSPPRYQKPPVK